MKVKVYVKNRDDKVATIKVNSKEDLNNIVVLAKSELLRMNMLKDIDYDDTRLIFKIDGDKFSAQKIVNMGLEILNKSDDTKKKKKKKNKDSDSKKSKKKDNNKKSSKDKDSKKKKKKKNKDGKKKDNTINVEDGYIHMTRIG